MRETFLDHVKAETYSVLDKDEYARHELTLSFMKKGVLEDEYRLPTAPAL
jgi:hypothetical protein